jgi:hypothetical protein
LLTADATDADCELRNANVKPQRVDFKGRLGVEGPMSKPTHFGDPVGTPGQHLRTDRRYNKWQLTTLKFSSSMFEKS